MEVSRSRCAHCQRTGRRARDLESAGLGRPRVYGLTMFLFPVGFPRSSAAWRSRPGTKSNRGENCCASTLVCWLSSLSTRFAACSRGTEGRGACHVRRASPQMGSCQAESSGRAQQLFLLSTNNGPVCPVWPVSVLCLMGKLPVAGTRDPAGRWPGGVRQVTCVLLARFRMHRRCQSSRQSVFLCTGCTQGLGGSVTRLLLGRCACRRG